MAATELAGAARLTPRALRLASQLPPDGPQRLLTGVAPASAWFQLTEAREELRNLVMDDPTDVVAVSALGLVSVATRIDAERGRKASRGATDEG